jgi:5-hydroxyisourate hydrolase
MGRLTTHVLDTARGRPAVGLALSLWRITPSGERILLTRTRTNADGRTAEPLLSGDAFTAGTYELVFEVGDYFAGYPDTSQPPFLDFVPVRFTVADPAAHYHVPLLVSPWSYATYRGS